MRTLLPNPHLGVALTSRALQGWDIGVISGCLIMRDFVKRFGEPSATAVGGYILTDSHQAEITALLSAGTFFGAIGQVSPMPSIAGESF